MSTASDTKTPGDADSPPDTYGGRLQAAAKWGAGAIATVGSVAVTKLGLEKLGKGEGDGALTTWAFVGIGSVALAAVAIVAVVIWHARSGRVTIGYLLEDGDIPTRIAKYFKENAYLLGGQPNLSAFRDRLTELVRAPRPLESKDQVELRRLIATRTTILDTAASERARYVSRTATSVLAAATLAAALGAATFAFATNRDQLLRDDRLAKEARERELVVTGELLPRTPTPVLLVAPETGRAWVTQMLGASCDASTVKALLMDAGIPPGDAAQPPPLPPAAPEASNFQIVTERTKDCPVQELWVPPSWLVQRTDAPLAQAATATAAPKSSAQPTPATE